ncbi:hypothetical protein SARI_04555 [Salmonella enterica subsp. arizonae serovar 62:z4,z23:-]|uniref:Uncharacterized protein n=1 Tax=Salmonella arizonae (strain ATCC BAA-731 / CDC346-86 / RSK2980) TaxID=41514 RepID=A9MRD0_SALAR|nr:hypothetical protein SARI_04555 [Salmonella enterica subsp. arizonae serovar 62:z4,z23:-]
MLAFIIADSPSSFRKHLFVMRSTIRPPLSFLRLHFSSFSFSNNESDYIYFH